MSAPAVAPTSYDLAQRIARQAVRRVGPRAIVGIRLVAALLVELDTRAERLGDAAAERAALVRELAVVYDERDAALRALDGPAPTPRQSEV